MWQEGYQRSKGLLRMFWKEGMGEGTVNNLDEFSDDGSDASGSDVCMNGLHTAMLKPGLPLVSANCVGILWPRCCSRTLANLPANSESPTYKEDHVLQIHNLQVSSSNVLWVF